MELSLANQSDSSPVPRCKRIVKPRKCCQVDKPVIAVHDGMVMLEDGETLTMEDLPLVVRTHPSSIIVASHIGPIVQYLDKAFEKNNLWQFRASPIERVAWAPNRKRKATTKDCIVGYFGFKGENKQAGHYHYPLSPRTFILKSISELRKDIPGENTTIVKLMEWAKEVRTFLRKNGLKLSPTSGGIAAQLLKDGRFYPSPRRKVPKKTNRHAREFLPGNYYRLYSAKAHGKTYEASYLDQVSAHHTIAKNLEFPDANSLEAHGRYATLQDIPFAREGTAKYQKFISQYGLFYLAIEVPMFFANDFPLPNCEGPSHYKKGYFYSNEIPYLKQLGVRIRHIIACWTSPDRDKGLNRYAKWALEQISTADPKAKPWLKPTLLSTYGVLASKPHKLEFGFKHAKGGEPKKYPCGSGFLDVEAVSTKYEREAAMANVIHRGMIEAQTRLNSLELARSLAQEGHTILAIYADSVFVDSEKPLPLLPSAWRIEGHLTALRFQSSTHFTSVELSKTPGLPSDFRHHARLPPRPKART